MTTIRRTHRWPEYAGQRCPAAMPPRRRRCRSTASAIPMARDARSIDVNFTVAPASFTALLGLNGAGKSTLFSLVTRLFGIQNGAHRHLRP